MNHYSWEYHFLGSACHLQTHQPAASESCVATVCFYGTYCGHRWVEIDCCGGLDGPLSSAKWSNVAIIADSSLKAISPSNAPSVGELYRQNRPLRYQLELSIRMRSSTGGCAVKYIINIIYYIEYYPY